MSFSLLEFVFLVRKEVALTNGEVIVSALKETLRYGLFLGTFAGTFVSMDELIGALGGHRRHVLFFSLETIDSLLLIFLFLFFGSKMHITSVTNCRLVVKVIQNSVT